MQLLYIWIDVVGKKDLDGNSVINDLNLSFTDEYKINYNKDANFLSIEKNESKIPSGFFDSNSEGVVQQVSCIVGSNGAGKTTILKHILETDCLSAKEKPHWKTIQVIKYDKEIFVYHNIENLKTNTKLYKIYDCSSKEKLIENNTEILISGNYFRTSRLFFSNDSYVRLDSSTYTHERTKQIGFNLNDLNTLKSFFYNKCSLNTHKMEYFNDWFHRYNQILTKDIRSNQFQSVIDLLLLKSIKDNKMVERFKYFNSFRLRCLDITKIFKPPIDITNEIWSDSQILKGKDRYEFLKNIIHLKYDRVLTHIDYDNIITILTWKHLLKSNSINNEHNLGVAERLELYLMLEIIMVLYDWKDYQIPSDKFILSDLLMELKNALIADSKKSKKGESLSKLQESRKEQLLSYFIIANNAIESLKKIEKNKGLRFDKEYADEVLEFIKDQVISNQSFVLKYILVDGLAYSSGERAFLNIYSWLNMTNYLRSVFDIKFNLYDNILLLIDEPDLYCHPEWQKRMIKELIEMCNILFKGKKVHLIYSTHSPITLSDIPRRNTICLNKVDGEIRIIDDEERSETFGANIYDLYNDSYFLKEFIGDFARSKIDEAIGIIYEKYTQIMNNEDNSRISIDNIYNNAKSIVPLIGEPIIKRKLEQMIDRIEKSVRD